MIIPWIYFLKEDEQLLIETFTRRWTVNGPGRVLTRPFWKVKKRPALTLGPVDYLIVRNTLTGEQRNVLGPQLFFLAADEMIVSTLKAIPLKHNEYIRLIDRKTGAIRVERGENTVYLHPDEEILENVKEGVNIDDETAVVLRDTRNGQLSLVTEQQVFIPTATQKIDRIEQRIRLEDKEAMVIKDISGRYVFRRGSDAERSFFLQPYDQIVELHWSAGLHKDRRSLAITRFDLRPKFMWYEFESRTRDNVELIIGITFFWEISDLALMINATDDTPGDICAHARSSIIQAVSQVNLEQFLDRFNLIIADAVLGGDTSFYSERGVTLHSVEVRSIASKDPSTQKVLQEIINETTNRINRLQKQESANEVHLKQLQGEIEVEQQRSQLLQLRREHAQIEGMLQGESESLRVKAFLDGLGDGVTIIDKVALFNTLRRQEALTALSKGSAQLYFTPSDIDLTIRSS